MNKTRTARCLAAALALCLALSLAACSQKREVSGDAPVIGDLTYESTVPLLYADQFAIYRYEGGYSLIDMVNSDRILVIPEGGETPEGLESDIVVIRQPLRDIYLAATSAMALFDSLDALDRITFVGSRNWYSENAVRARTIPPPCGE